MKKVLAMIFVLAMLVSSVAMAETIVVMPKLVGIPYFNASEVGVKAAGEELGIDARYTGPTEGDAALQVQMIEDLLVDGIDALAIAPNDPDSVSPVLQKCIADNVLVLDWDTTANGDDVTYSVHQIDDKVLGETLIDLLVDKMGEEGEYAIVTGYLTAANLNTWIKYGQDYAAEKYPGLKLVTDPVASDESQQEAYNQALALIQAYPDLKGIIVPTTVGGPAVCKCIQDAGANVKVTGLTIASSGMLGQTGADGQALQGVQLTMAAFSSALGPAGSYLVSIGIVLFAFSTILGWEYHGEKAFEYIVPRRGPIMAYRIIFSLIVYVGATQALDLVWNISDIMNALMAIPNLISLIVLSGTIKEEVERFQPILEKEKKARKAHAGNAGLGGVAAGQ